MTGLSRPGSLALNGPDEAEYENGHKPESREMMSNDWFLHPTFPGPVALMIMNEN